MDASSSAYQIMSYFLFNKDLAKRTNLIQSEDVNKINDLYNSLLEDLPLDLRVSFQPSVVSLRLFALVS
jgi:hypothetical protein